MSQNPMTSARTSVAALIETAMPGRMKV